MERVRLNRLRIAASTYLNSAPLVDDFVHGVGRESYRFIGDEAPSRCARLLAAGECEIALIPAIEYQRIPGLRIIPGLAVASKERVRSVIIASRSPLSAVRRLALDTSSRTSQALARIIFHCRFGAEPEMIERSPDPDSGYQNMFEGTDAALVIGDPAMKVEVIADRLGLQIHDLAAEWREMTGHPFVFAVWAVREEVAGLPEISAMITRDFLRARAEGLKRREQIACQYAPSLGLPVGNLLEYLRTNVNYDLDAENLAGLTRYYQLAESYGLIPENRPLLFLPSANPVDETTEAVRALPKMMA